MGFLTKLFGFSADTPTQFIAEETDHSIGRVKRTAHYLIESAEEQGDAIHETMASITEIRSMLSQTENHVARSLQVTEQTKQHSTERLKTVERLQRAMDAIKDSNLLLSDLQTSFQQIKSKARVINDIVSKTQLLSFNASIEAARAGQFGKGFSVVAEEVGRLAQSSGHAAKEIESLLNESQLRAMTVVEMVVARANEGVAVAREVKESFTGMAKSVSEISIALTSMSQASREQSLGIERTTSALEKISTSATKIKKSAEELLAATDQSVARLADRKDLGLDINDLIETMENKESVTSPIPVKSASKIEADDPSFRSQD